MIIKIENFEFENTTRYLEKMAKKDPSATMKSIGQTGVSMLSAVTPVDTGRLASGWAFNVQKTSRGWELYWYNRAYPGLYPSLVRMLEYGHGTGTGGYVPGRHFVKRVSNSLLPQASKSLRKEMSE